MVGSLLVPPAFSAPVVHGLAKFRTGDNQAGCRLEGKSNQISGAVRNAFMAYRKGDSIIGFTPSFPPFVYLYHFLLLLVRLVDWFVFRLKIKGRENIRKIERALLVSNHTLLISDACFSGSIFKTRSAFRNASVAIQELYKLPSRNAIVSGIMTEVPDKSIFVEFLRNLKHILQKPLLGSL